MQHSKPDPIGTTIGTMTPSAPGPVARKLFKSLTDIQYWTRTRSLRLDAGYRSRGRETQFCACASLESPIGDP